MKVGMKVGMGAANYAKKVRILIFRQLISGDET